MLGKYDVDVDAVGKATPRMEPDAKLENPPGVLAIPYCLRGGVGSCEDAEDDSVRA